MNITKPITYTKDAIECNICLEDTTIYTKFCKCNVKTCLDCFYKLIYISDKMLCNCCAGNDANSTYLKFIIKCPLCRLLKSSPLNEKTLHNLKITDKMMVKYILDYNNDISKNLVEYNSDFDSDYDSQYESDDEFEYDGEYSRRHRITGFPYPRIDRHDLINTMIILGFRHLFNF